ncbi:50S ribosomal protein L24 [Candidatus Woesearchaeota archaeon]|nr:50S ribosomal protein L24 [Candidatus Woesearchaeota archaeon]MBW3017421.1 50S ribosomal protein L24 [Candidatus Woesearchaeota archaeon]
MKNWSKHWKSSEKAGKQRKYRYNAPKHIRAKLISSHLSKELRQKHSTRSMPLRKGDSVKVMRGRLKGETKKVESVDRNAFKVYLEGARITKTDGTEVPIVFEPSNLLITSLNTEDKRRFKERVKQEKAAKPALKQKPVPAKKPEAKKQVKEEK